jgi:hypothetical protein
MERPNETAGVGTIARRADAGDLTARSAGVALVVEARHAFESVRFLPAAPSDCRGRLRVYS